MSIIYKYNDLKTTGKLVKRPSKIVKSPYIADIIINKEEHLAHYPALGVSGLLNSSSNFYVVIMIHLIEKVNIQLNYVIYLPLKLIVF